MRPLPRPLTPDQEFAAGICARLDGLADVLGEIRDRLGQAPADDSTGAASGDAAPVELCEPDPGPAAPNSAVDLTEPATTDQKPAPRKRATKSTKGAGR